jgi:glyoxylase-like metal-dependent hydrolase (beta-lactamase superfamily II)
VLGRGTSVVAHPDGDLVAYLDSLRRVLQLGPDVLFPGHGPELTIDPSAGLRYYAEHRAFRRAQLQAALRDGPATPERLVERIYHDVDPRLWPAAEASTRAALTAMAREGTVRWAPDGPAELVDDRVDDRVDERVDERGDPAED